MKNLIIIITLFLGLKLQAQDLHFSQYQYTAAYLNPAQTAMDMQGSKVGLHYRNQWAKIPAAYQSTLAFYEMRYKDFGWGGMIHQNGAGAASLKTTGVQLTLGYHKRLSEKGNTLSAGAMLGILQKKFDPALFTFEDQFVEGRGFESALSNNENFMITNKMIPDLGAGINYTHFLNKNIYANIGFSLSHFHQPMEGQEPSSQLPLKWNLTGSTNLSLKNKIEIQPNLLYQRQAQHQILLLGISAKKSISPLTKLGGGLSLRLKDAVIAHLEVQQKDFNFIFSYDMNTSGLRRATNGSGAFELGIQYRFKIKKKEKIILKTPILPEPVIKDTDGDGIVDSRDNCPNTPGFTCLMGCPDSDSDGVADKDDSCPALFGQASNNGCPLRQNDTDLDGIPDDLDQCVFLKGSKAMNGCPDSDKDGLSDLEDRCPFIKGAISNNGCPVIAANTPVTSSKIILEFDTDKSFIRNYNIQKLNNLVKELRTNSRYHLMIAGYTDAEGDPVYNFQLGKKRAMAVMDYLVRQGLSAEQMEVISYGETQPIAENNSESGKQKNRRVKITIIR